jgi:hypothetical protein
VKPLGKLRPLDLLDGEEPCLAAAFCSFTFDPELFENHILRAALRLRADPTEEPRRYHQEARAALQETPVVAIVDAAMRGPGHRLPYDLLEVHARVFHPKLALLLFDDYARVLLGSGNLTRGGFGDNTELWFHHDCSYDGDAALLWQLHRFLEDARGLTRHQGTQLELLQAILTSRLPAASAAQDARPFTLLSSFDAPILSQLRAAIPEGAKLDGASVLAPFFEADDVQAAEKGDCEAVLHGLVADTDAPIEIGVVWDPSPLHPPKAVERLDDAVGQLCVLVADKEDGTRSCDYLTIQNATPSQIQFLDAHGNRRRTSRDEAEHAIENAKLGPVGPIDVFAPKHLVESLGQRHDVSFWLHPSWRYEDGRPYRRPLHAKLALLRYTRRKRPATLVLMGSPNPSRGAMLRRVDEAGNVELGVAFVLEGHHHLADICPELVLAPTEQLRLKERAYPEGAPNLALWINSAVHDAEAGNLTITWSERGPAPLPAWELHYLDRVLARGAGPPSSPTVIEPFDLLPTSCELELRAKGERFTVPITVRDLTALPVDASLAGLTLQELLALLGRRIGNERLATLRRERGSAGAHLALEAIFGEGFSPTDVFRAWWSLATGLAEERTTLGSFRAQVDGALGCRAVWIKLRQTVDAEEEAARLSPDEAWFYGAELLHTLRAITLPEGPDAPTKSALLETFLIGLKADLAELSPNPERGRWVKKVLAHYDLGGGP